MFTIYSKPGCSYCDQAKALLESKGLAYQVKELDVGQVKVPGVEYYTIAQLQALVPGARTVPQIFEVERLIGGFTALKQKLSA